MERCIKVGNLEGVFIMYGFICFFLFIVEGKDVVRVGFYLYMDFVFFVFSGAISVFFLGYVDLVTGFF